MRQREIEFIRQLGYRNVHPDHRLYVALMFQPRTVACVVALGVVLQSAGLFLALSAALWLGAAAPTRNLFDAVFNRLIACPGRDDGAGNRRLLVLWRNPDCMGA